MSKYVGIKFIDNFFNTREVAGYDSDRCFYIVPSVKTSGAELMTDKNIEFHLGRQEKYIKAMEKREQERKDAELEAEKERLKFYKLNLFLDSLTPLQAGKARKHLVEKGLIYGKCMSNMEFVEHMISIGRTPQQHTYKSNNKTTWGFKNDHGAHIDISTTQYKYSQFLINNKLIDSIQEIA